jgi:hypothetical protein
MAGGKYKKLTSLWHLQSCGLNVPKYWPIRSEREAARFNFNRCVKWGLRGDSPYHENRLPFKTTLAPEEARLETATILREHPHLIVLAQEYIDFDDQLLAGKYLKEKGHTVIECFTGNRSIRRAIEDGTNLIRFTSLSDYPYTLQPFKGLIRRGLIDKFSDWLSCCVEWSIYPYEIGILRQRIIYWEL